MNISLGIGATEALLSVPLHSNSSSSTPEASELEHRFCSDTSRPLSMP